MSLESYRVSIERAYRCVEAGHVEVGLWVLAGAHDRLADAIEAQSESCETYDDLVWRAMQLAAPNLAVCEALIRGEAVPLDRLNADAVRRFGLREGRR